jgi:hypothetical protein
MDGPLAPTVPSFKRVLFRRTCHLKTGLNAAHVSDKQYWQRSPRFKLAHRLIIRRGHRNDVGLFAGSI